MSCHRLGLVRRKMIFRYYNLSQSVINKKMLLAILLKKRNVIFRCVSTAYGYMPIFVAFGSRWKQSGDDLWALVHGLMWGCAR